MSLKILLTMILFFAGSCLTGYALQRILRLKHEGVLASVVMGVMCWWALMEVILVPMTMRLASFDSFVLVYSVVLLAVVLAGGCCWREIKEDGRYLAAEVKRYLTFGHVLAFFLICCQLYFVHRHMYLEWDDAYYVNLANEAVFSDRIYWIYPETGFFADFDKRYVLSLWPIFYAWLSEVFGVIPTIMAHTILPWLIIPLAYMVYMLIGKRLFPEDEQLQGMFMTLVVLLHLFMSGEHTAGLTFLSITPWVGKGVLATVLIPMLFYCLLRTVQDCRPGNWILLAVTGLGGCLLSSMGIMLSPVFIGMTAFLVMLSERKIQYLLYGLLACIPCIILGIYYIILTR